jgi:2-hydroxy-3-oxopropionate reductase
MVGHLLDGGHEVTSCVHRTPAPDELTKKGLKVVKSAKEVAGATDVIITMVPDTPQVDAVLFGENGVAEGLSKGKLVIDSLAPMAGAGLAALLALAGSLGLLAKRRRSRRSARR